MTNERNEQALFAAYTNALDDAGWTREEFEAWKILSDHHGDGLAGYSVLDNKMYATDEQAWSNLLDTFYAYEDVCDGDSYKVQS